MPIIVFYSIKNSFLKLVHKSFWKEDLAALEKQPGRSPMPSYRGRLSDHELDDLVAYLVSLRGDR